MLFRSLSDVISQTCKDAEDVRGEYQLVNLKVTISNLETYEHNLIKLDK